jgi:predicted dehydrogenase
LQPVANNLESCDMSEIGIGIIGGGYMGKAHSVAFASVAGVFDTALRPKLVTICASTPKSAETYRKAYGFEKATSDWRDMVADPDIHAIVIASPQATHHDIALAALAAGKPVLCEKPLGISLEESHSMVAAAKASGLANMVGFNYIRTPASQQVRKFLAEGRIGEVTWFRGEMTEDFLLIPQ